LSIKNEATAFFRNVVNDPPNVTTTRSQYLFPAPPPLPAHSLFNDNTLSERLYLSGGGARCWPENMYSTQSLRSGRWGMRCEWSRCRYVTSVKPVGAARPPTEPLLHFI